MSKEAFELENQQLSPKSSVGGFELPCGWIGPDGKLYRDVELREITGVEEDIMVSPSLTAPQKVSRVLGNCLLRMGPVQEKQALLEAARRLLSGDRVYLLICARRISLGDIYPVEEKCPQCGALNYFELDLKELESVSMPDPMTRIFPLELPSGRKATVKLLTGVDEERGAQLVKAADMATLAIALRLEALDGTTPTLEEIKALPLKDRNAIRDAFDEREGGVDTSLELACPRCGHEYATDADITQRGFFSPSSMKKSSRKKSSK